MLYEVEIGLHSLTHRLIITMIIIIIMAAMLYEVEIGLHSLLLRLIIMIMIIMIMIIMIIIIIMIIMIIMIIITMIIITMIIIIIMAAMLYEVQDRVALPNAQSDHHDHHQTDVHHP